MDSLWVAGEKANVNVVSKWSSGDWEQYLTCLASLAVFGGSSEILRLGARLMDRADSKMFTAIAIQRAEGQVDVIEDSEGAVSTCNLAQVLPVPDVLPAPELLTLLLDQGVIETLAKVLQRPEGLHGGESESNASVESVLASELVSANLRSLAFVLHHDEIKRRFLSLGMNTFGPFGYCCFFFCFFLCLLGKGSHWTGSASFWSGSSMDYMGSVVFYSCGWIPYTYSYICRKQNGLCEIWCDGPWSARSKLTQSPRSSKKMWWIH